MESAYKNLMTETKKPKNQEAEAQRAARAQKELARAVEDIRAQVGPLRAALEAIPGKKNCASWRNTIAGSGRDLRPP